MSTAPLTLTAAGPVPTSPTTLLANLIAAVAATNPDYTANLPGSLIEDISSTDVGALVTIDQARVDAVNNLTPYAANPYVLSQLGVQSGVSQAAPSNTSVYVVISGTPGYYIPKGFLVSDGTHQYEIQDGGAIATGGSTSSLYAIATTSGSWAVPANTVTKISTSVPPEYSLIVTNPSTGIPGGSAESVEDYRSRVLQAGLVAGQGTPSYITTLLLNLPGVSSRLTKVLQTTSGWEVICGGGDPYQTAAAIYAGTLDLFSIIGSFTTVRNISATIIDYPNTYTLTYVNPPMQTVTVAATWNTILSNFTGSVQVNSLGVAAIQNYLNSILVGEPINLLDMTNEFQTAVSGVLPIQYLTTLDFAVTINGNPVSPSAGTSIIPSDAESYFYASASSVTVAQG